MHSAAAAAVSRRDPQARPPSRLQLGPRKWTFNRQQVNVSGPITPLFGRDLGTVGHGDLVTQLPQQSQAPLCHSNLLSQGPLPSNFHSSLTPCEGLSYCGWGSYGDCSNQGSTRQGAAPLGRKGTEQKHFQSLTRDPQPASASLCRPLKACMRHLDHSLQLWLSLPFIALTVFCPAASLCKL